MIELEELQSYHKFSSPADSQESRKKYGMNRKSLAYVAMAIVGTIVFVRIVRVSFSNTKIMGNSPITTKLDSKEISTSQSLDSNLKLSLENAVSLRGRGGKSKRAKRNKKNRKRNKKNRKRREKRRRENERRRNEANNGGQGGGVNRRGAYTPSLAQFSVLVIF